MHHDIRAYTTTPADSPHPEDLQQYFNAVSLETLNQIGDYLSQQERYEGMGSTYKLLQADADWVQGQLERSTDDKQKEWAGLLSVLQEGDLSITAASVVPLDET